MDSPNVYGLILEPPFRDDDDPNRVVGFIDPSLGLFGKTKSARAAAEELNAPRRARYEEAMAAYEAEVQAWEREHAEAEAAGTVHSTPRPIPPQEPDWYIVAVSSRISRGMNPDLRDE